MTCLDMVKITSMVLDTFWMLHSLKEAENSRDKVQEIEANLDKNIVEKKSKYNLSFYDFIIIVLIYLLF